MKSYLLLKYLTIFLREYIFIFLTATIFLFITFTKSYSEENVFTVNNVKVEGIVNLNFSREKYLNRAFLDSFEMLMEKILLSRDLKKVSDIKILYNETRVKKFLRQKNISFSQPENISVVFYPVLFINEEIKNFNENFFYKNWMETIIKNETINFILPLEDLEDISKIIEMKNRIEELNIDTFINKYDIKNYVFALMNYQNNELNIHLKTNFNNNKISKNFSYEVKNINDQLVLKSVLKDLKFQIADLWKEENLVNLLMPLAIKLKFQHTNLKNLDKLRNTFYKISLIDSYVLEEFNINNSYFKIYYYGDPKKLKSELLKFGYQLKNDKGFWQLYLDE